MNPTDFFNGRPAFELRDPRVSPQPGDRMRRQDAKRVDVWQVWGEGEDTVVTILASDDAGQPRDQLTLEEYQLLAVGWRVVWVASYVPAGAHV